VGPGDLRQSEGTTRTRAQSELGHCGGGPTR